MLKRRNRIYRRIAVALTVALLAGQSHAFVLAEEDAGGASQTEVTGEADTSTPDNDSDLDNDNTPDGGNDSQIPDDNGNQGDQQGDGDGQDKCICGTKCAADAVNIDCPVCATDYEVCTGKADDEGNNGSENGDTEDNDLENGGQDQCICETVCTEENVNMDCPVCAADYANCAKNAGEGVSSSVDAALPEMAPASMADEEAGIDALADEAGGTFEYTYNGKTLKYTVTKKDGDTRKVALYDQDENTVSGDIDIPATVEDSDGNQYSVTTIGYRAFLECRNLTCITIPEGVTTIDAEAFAVCDRLRRVEIPNSVINIDGGAFMRCPSLSSVEIPDGVRNITMSTFSGCESLSSVRIPDSVVTIGGWAFSGCKELKELKISISSDEKYKFPECGRLIPLPFSEAATERYICFVDEKGKKLTGERYENAKAAFEEAAKADGDPSHNPDDGKWWGWSLREPSEIADTFNVTIKPQKDGEPWATDCDRKFALTKDNGTTFVTNLDAVEAGEYTIYDVTNSGNKLNTGVTVMVENTDASATVDYYTVYFCYLDDADKEQKYGDSTDWKPQIVLKDKGRVAEPATNPTKADHTFDKWVTAPNEETAFAFETTPITAKDTKIYAKWTENAVTTYYTVTFYDGTTPYGADTPQSPQRVASGQQALRPDDPTESKDPDKAGWEFAGWKTTDGGSTPYDFDTPVTGDISIYASWVEKTVVDSLRIQATATEGGTIAPKGEIIVSKGGERTFTITPDEGNKIKAVTVDEEDVTAELKDTRARAQAGARYYTFTNIVKDHTIHAEFERDGSSSGDGGDNPDPGGDNPGGGSGGGGGGDSGGGTSTDGGNGTGNTANADTGNGAGNGQTVTGTAVSSAQAGSGAAAAAAGSNAASGAGKAVGGSASSVAGTAGNGKEPKTGDASYLEVYATLAMIAGLTYLLLYVLEESRGMSEREKEAFVAAFIRWGKKGGAFRKCCAMAAIFCLLAYYHIIGKNVGENALRKKHLGQAF